MKLYGKENIKYESEKLVAEWIEAYKPEKAKHKFDFAIASKDIVIDSDEDIEIDFILVGHAGVLVIEVKGGNVSIENGIWKSNGNGLKEDPFWQAKDHYYGLWKLIVSKTSVKNMVGYYSVAFPGIKINSPLNPAHEMAMYFDSRLSQAPEVLIDSVIELSHAKFGIKTLSDTKIEEIRELLVPNYNDYITDLTASDDDRVLRLSEEQLVALEGLEDVKRMIIEGPPGSGKTILAIEQALKNESYKIKTLFVCYNRALANKLKAVLNARIGGPQKYITFESLTYVKTNVHDVDFEYLIADEAQDYLNNEGLIQLDTNMIGGIDNCKYRIFCDINQDLHNNIDYELLNDLKNRDDVVNYRLRYNYRNTSTIVFIAEIFSRLLPGEVKNNPSGEHPDFHLIPYKDEKNVDWIKYCKELSKGINKLIDDGYKPEDIISAQLSPTVRSGL